VIDHPAPPARDTPMVPRARGTNLGNIEAAQGVATEELQSEIEDDAESEEVSDDGTEEDESDEDEDDHGSAGMAEIEPGPVVLNEEPETMNGVPGGAPDLFAVNLVHFPTDIESITPTRTPGDATSKYGDTKDMIYTPHDGQTWTTPTSLSGYLGFLRSGKTYNQSRIPQDIGMLKEIARRYAFLRTYEKDIEMQSLVPDEAKLVCLDPLNHAQWHRHRTYGWSRRLNMLAHVPELALVVVAGLSGRVALVTPTRLRQGGGTGVAPLQKMGMLRGFRVERVLPTKKDEQAGRGVKKPLYGMAIGPVQERSTGGSLLLSNEEAAMTGPYKRYRLMLHYRDHSIHTYLISRDADTDTLSIF